MTPEDSAARQLEVVVPSAVFFLFQGTLGGTLSLPPVAESARPRLSDLQNCILSDQCEISSPVMSPKLLNSSSSKQTPTLAGF